MTFLGIYALATLVYLLICVVGSVSGTYSERRTAARYSFAAFVWPLVLVWLLVLGIRSLWRTAFS